MIFKKNILLLVFLLSYCDYIKAFAEGKNGDVLSELVGDLDLKDRLKINNVSLGVNGGKRGMFHPNITRISCSIPFTRILTSCRSINRFFFVKNDLKVDASRKNFFNTILNQPRDDNQAPTSGDKYKNLMCSSSSSTYIPFSYTFFYQLCNSNYFFFLGGGIDMIRYVYQFNYSVFKKTPDIFNKMKDAYDNFDSKEKDNKFWEEISDIVKETETVKNVDDEFKYQPYKKAIEDSKEKFLEKNNNNGRGNNNERENINTFKEVFEKIGEGQEKKKFLQYLKNKHLDYCADEFWERKSKEVSFTVINAYIIPFGVAYFQNKIDPFYGFYFSASVGLGLQFLINIEGIECVGGKTYNNNTLAFLIDNLSSQLGNMISFCTNFRLEFGYAMFKVFFLAQTFNISRYKNFLNGDKCIEITNPVIKLDDSYRESCITIAEGNSYKVPIEKDIKWFFFNKISFGISIEF